MSQTLAPFLKKIAGVEKITVKLQIVMFFCCKFKKYLK